MKLAQLSAIEQFSISRFREAFWRSIETARRKHFTVPRRFEKQNEARRPQRTQRKDEILNQDREGEGAAFSGQRLADRFSI
ncbi:MAG: hypothetical protein ABSH16_05525 [Sedimentisphaerales bacterium]